MAGDNFTAEVGLTGYDGWCAKFPLEMTWWHVAHYALWNRWSMTEKAMTYYTGNTSPGQSHCRQFRLQGAHVAQIDRPHRHQ